MGRVHIIDHVLTPYLQFEIDWYYAINGAAGEDIRFIYREDVPDLAYTDTWLFDDTTVVDLSYTAAGELLYINQNDDPERLEQARTAWREFHARSFPLAQLLADIRGHELAVPRHKATVHTEFVINDQAAGYPTRTVTAEVEQDELGQLVQQGYLVRRDLISPDLTANLREGVRELAEAEEGKPGAEWVALESIYLRRLLDKNARFHRLLRLEPILSIARTLLGPQVWIDLEARMHYPGRAGVVVPWHNHLPVIPEPLPAFFCYPHQLHCLIYLDRVSAEEGALLVLPGSHLRAGQRIPLGDRGDRTGQVELFFEPGDAVIIHGNLWHRTAPSTAQSKHRTLLLLGYLPSWIRNEVAHGVPVDEPLTTPLARTGDAELKELLGEFHW